MGTGRFVVAGEALVDVVHPADGPVVLAPGGSPLNVAVGLARLGVPVLLVTELGEDELGRLIVEHLEASGVLLAEGSVVPGLVTSTATARLDERRAATYDFDVRWGLRRRHLPQDALGLHVGSIGAVLRPGRDAVLDLLDQAHRRGLLATFDPNVRPAFSPQPEEAWRDVLDVAGRSRLVKLSDEDLAFLRPGAAERAVAEELLDAGAELVVVTRGAEGAAGHMSDGAVTVPAPPTEVTDTVGAGDSFMSALVAVALQHGLAAPPEAVVAAAVQAAAVTVSRRGADPPWAAELGPGWPGLE